MAGYATCSFCALCHLLRTRRMSAALQTPSPALVLCMYCTVVMASWQLMADAEVVLAQDMLLCLSGAGWSGQQHLSSKGKTGLQAWHTARGNALAWPAACLQSHSSPCQRWGCMCTGEVDGSSLELAFSKKKVEDRKAWLQNYVPGTYLDMTQAQITYSDFVNQVRTFTSKACHAVTMLGLLFHSTAAGWAWGQAIVLHA